MIVADELIYKRPLGTNKYCRTHPLRNQGVDKIAQCNLPTAKLGCVIYKENTNRFSRIIHAQVVEVLGCVNSEQSCIDRVGSLAHKQDLLKRRLEFHIVIFVQVPGSRVPDVNV